METIDLGQERSRRRSDVFVAEPTVTRMNVCPTCKSPLDEAHFGNVIDYWPPLGKHEHTARCASGRDFRKHGYCLIPCPTCSGDVKEKRVARMIDSLFGDSHIPFYAKDWTFASFPGDKTAKKDVQGFLLKAIEGQTAKRGLYLSGDVGKCKTSLAISALQFVIRKGYGGVFVTTKELFSILKESIAASQRLQHGDVDAVTRFEASKGARLLKLLREVEWAAFDDLGVEAGSKYEIGELYLLLEARRASGLYTIFTSNFDRSGLGAYWKANTDDARRIIDRLGEYCTSVPVGGENQRRKDAR